MLQHRRRIARLHRHRDHAMFLRHGNDVVFLGLAHRTPGGPEGDQRRRVASADSCGTFTWLPSVSTPRQRRRRALGQAARLPVLGAEDHGEDQAGFEQAALPALA
jgi:hypothetical protein